MPRQDGTKPEARDIGSVFTGGPSNALIQIKLKHNYERMPLYADDMNNCMVKKSLAFMTNFL